MTTFIISVLIITLAIVSYAYKKARYDARSNWNYAVEMSREKHEMRDMVIAYQKVLSGTTGGVGKRINECREITESVFKGAPTIFQDEPGLIYWLEATDQFLSELHQLNDDSLQNHVANGRGREIYTTVHNFLGN